MNNDNFNKIKNKLSLNDYASNNNPSKPDTNKAIQTLNIADNKPINIESKQIALDGDSNKKINTSNSYIKTTFSLSDKLLDRLETVWLTSRKAKMITHKKVTKTEIVEAALDIMLTDFENHLELSKIIQKIKKQ
jgi:hypothetical protein